MIMMIKKKSILFVINMETISKKLLNIQWYPPIKRKNVLIRHLLHLIAIAVAIIFVKKEKEPAPAHVVAPVVPVVAPVAHVAPVVVLEAKKTNLLVRNHYHHHPKDSIFYSQNI
jgi:hypothetical protein